jgi:hypothetical protein
MWGAYSAGLSERNCQALFEDIAGRMHVRQVEAAPQGQGLFAQYGQQASAQARFIVGAVLRDINIRITRV